MNKQKELYFKRMSVGKL